MNQCSGEHEVHGLNVYSSETVKAAVCLDQLCHEIRRVCAVIPTSRYLGRSQTTTDRC